MYIPRGGRILAVTTKWFADGWKGTRLNAPALSYLLSRSLSGGGAGGKW